MTADVVRRATTLVDAGRYEDALRDLAPHLAHHPDDGDALCVGARALIGVGRNDDAQRAARRVVTLRPDDAWPLRLLAIAAAAAGHEDEALDAAERAVAVAPQDWRCHYQFAQVRHALNRVTPAAVAAAEKARALAPNAATAHRMAGAVHAALGERREARACYERALAIDPTDAVSRHELARLQLHRGRLTSAADGFASAVRLDPRLQVGLANLDVVIHQALTAVSTVVVVAAFVTVQVHGATVPAAVSALVLLGALWFRRSTGSRLDRYLRAFPRRQLLLTAAACLIGVALAALWVEAFAPEVPWRPAAMFVAVLSCAAATQCRRHWAMGRQRRGR